MCRANLQITIDVDRLDSTTCRCDVLVKDLLLTCRANQQIIIYVGRLDSITCRYDMLTQDLLDTLVRSQITYHDLRT